MYIWLFFSTSKTYNNISLQDSRSTDTRSLSSQISKGLRARKHRSSRSLNQGSDNPPREKDSKKTKKAFTAYLYHQRNKKEKNDLVIDDDEIDRDKPSVHYPIVHFQCSLLPSAGSRTRSTSSTDCYDDSSCTVSMMHALKEN